MPQRSPFLTRSPRRRRRAPLWAWVWAWAAILATAGPARAQTPDAVDTDASPAGARGERVRVAVLLLPAGEVAPETADDLTELLIGAVAARGGVTLLGREEFQTRLGQGNASTLECISSIPCIGRVGVTLDVSEVIAGTLARRGEAWIFNLNRVDVRTGDVVGRVFREVDGALGVVADALVAALPELYVATEAEVPPGVPAAGSLVVDAPRGAEVSLDGALLGVVGEEPLRSSGVAVGRHEVRVSMSGFSTWTRTIRSSAGDELRLEVRLREATTEEVSPLVWGLSGVFAASLSAAIALGASSQSILDVTRDQRVQGEVTRAALVAFYEARGREALAANLLFGVSGAAAIAAVVMLFFPERHLLSQEDDAGNVRLAPTLGGLELRGRF